MRVCAWFQSKKPKFEGTGSNKPRFPQRFGPPDQYNHRLPLPFSNFFLNDSTIFVLSAIVLIFPGKQILQSLLKHPLPWSPCSSSFLRLIMNSAASFLVTLIGPLWVIMHSRVAVMYSSQVINSHRVILVGILVIV